MRQYYLYGENVVAGSAVRLVEKRQVSRYSWKMALSLNNRH
jgi:hypothetical protein